MVTNQDPFPEFVPGLIRRKVRQMIRSSHYQSQDAEDLQQELSLHLVERLPRFDPQRGSINAFVNTVLERRASTLKWDRWCAKRDDHRCLSFEDDLPERGDFQQQERQRDLALDLRQALATLPEPLRELAERLKTHAISEIAREFRLSRTTIYKRLRDLRQSLENTGWKQPEQNAPRG